MLPLAAFEERAVHDLNYLYQRHQISLYMSEHAACERSRSAHKGLTEAYASVIATVRRGRRMLCVQ